MELAFDADGNRLDAAELFEGVARRRAEKYGRLKEALWERMEHAKEDDKIDVIIWPRLDLPAAPYEKPLDAPLREPPRGERGVEEIVLKAGRLDLPAALERTGLHSGKPDGDKDRFVPTIHIAATVAQIRELPTSDAVGIILLDDKTAIPDLDNSIAVARSNIAQSAGFDGTGIRVAVWENGPSDTTDLNFTDRFTTTPSAIARALRRPSSKILSQTGPMGTPLIAAYTRLTAPAPMPCFGLFATNTAPSSARAFIAAVNPVALGYRPTISSKIGWHCDGHIRRSCRPRVTFGLPTRTISPRLRASSSTTRDTTP